MGNAFCPDQCCSAFLLPHCTPVWKADLHRCIAVTQACCEPVLQSSTEQWGMQCALPSAAVHFCWLTAYLYEEQTSIGATAVSQACCEPVLQSSTQQWGMHFALNSAAVHFCWVTAHLYEQQISTGVTAVAQGCCQPGLQSSTDQWGMHFTQTSAAVHLTCDIMPAVSLFYREQH